MMGAGSVSRLTAHSRSHNPIAGDARSAAANIALDGSTPTTRTPANPASTSKNRPVPAPRSRNETRGVFGIHGAMASRHVATACDDNARPTR